MIGLPEILIVLVLFLMAAGPVVAGVLIWKFAMKAARRCPASPAHKS
jgi:hypothetical protein